MLYQAKLNDIQSLPVAFKFPKSINIEKIKESVEKILDNYSAFSLRITMENGEPYFTKSLKFDKNIKVTQTTESELTKLKKAFIRPFNLINSPLYRF